MLTYKQQVSPKRWYPPTKLHGVTIHIGTAVKVKTIGRRQFGVTFHEALGNLSDVQKLYVFWEAINAKDVWPETGRGAHGEADTNANYIHRIMNQNWHQLWLIRLRRAGHVQCKAEQQTPKRLLHAKITWKRKVGRPKSRWSDVVNGDTRKLEIKCGKEEM